eukprot:1094311-Prymnesium_polylepis.1
MACEPWPFPMRGLVRPTLGLMASSKGCGAAPRQSFCGWPPRPSDVDVDVVHSVVGMAAMHHAQLPLYTHN